MVRKENQDMDFIGITQTGKLASLIYSYKIRLAVPFTNYVVYRCFICEELK